jgi:hypothetical protein
MVEFEADALLNTEKDNNIMLRFQGFSITQKPDTENLSY